jgi:hypothetical protein
MLAGIVLQAFATPKPSHWTATWYIMLRLKVIAVEETELQEGRRRPSETSQAQCMEERKDDTPLRREQCGVFMPCKNCNIETRSRYYTIVHEAVFSPCRTEDSRPEPKRPEA